MLLTLGGQALTGRPHEEVVQLLSSSASHHLTVARPEAATEPVGAPAQPVRSQEASAPPPGSKAAASKEQTVVLPRGSSGLGLRLVGSNHGPGPVFIDHVADTAQAFGLRQGQQLLRFRQDAKEWVDFGAVSEVGAPPRLLHRAPVLLRQACLRVPSAKPSHIFGAGLTRGGRRVRPGRKSAAPEATRSHLWSGRTAAGIGAQSRALLRHQQRWTRPGSVLARLTFTCRQTPVQTLPSSQGAAARTLPTSVTILETTWRWWRVCVAAEGRLPSLRWAVLLVPSRHAAASPPLRSLLWLRLLKAHLELLPHGCQTAPARGGRWAVGVGRLANPLRRCRLEANAAARLATTAPSPSPSALLPVGGAVTELAAAAEVAALVRQL